MGLLSQSNLQAAEKQAAKKSNKVMLGTAELTSGIPGKGSLTEKEIKDWLSDSANHEVLEITLPLGLNAGAGQIVGLKENPLTRAKLSWDVSCISTRVSLQITPSVVQAAIIPMKALDVIRNLASESETLKGDVTLPSVTTEF